MGPLFDQVIAFLQNDEEEAYTRCVLLEILSGTQADIYEEEVFRFIKEFWYSRDPELMFTAIACAGNLSPHNKVKALVWFEDKKAYVYYYRLEDQVVAFKKELNR